MIYLTLWLACCIGAGAIASSKKRSFVLWLLLGGLFGPIALLVIGFMAQADAAGRGERICPFCAETIKCQAKVCKHCGRDVEPELPLILPMQTSLKPFAVAIAGILLIAISACIYGALKKSIEDGRKMAVQNMSFPENSKYDMELFEYNRDTEINYILSVHKLYACLHGTYIYRYVTKEKAHILCNEGDGVWHEYTVYTKKDHIEKGIK